MATKLKKMKLTSVDLVRAGANQEADICLFKSAEEREKDVEAAQDQHREEVSGYHDALMASVRSIQEDKDLDEETRQDMLQETWEQYCSAMAEALGFEFEDEDLEAEGEEVTVEKEPEDRYDGLEEVPDFDEIEEVEKYNHNHGPDGKFAPSGGGGGGMNAKVKDLMSQKFGAYEVPKLVDQMKVGDRVRVRNHKKNEDYEFEKLSDKNTISAFQNVNGKNHMASPDHVKGWVLDDVLNGGTPTFVEKGLDTIVEVEKFNPFHDALGRFANKNGFKTYSANPKVRVAQPSIIRSAQAGHGKTMNVHAESKGENIGQNYDWLQTGQKPAGAVSTPPKPQKPKPPKPQPKTDPNTKTPTPVEGRDLVAELGADAVKKMTIDEILQAQGYDGLPRIADSESSFANTLAENGNVCVRSWDGAGDPTDVPTMQAYDTDLKHGDFYTKCEGGNALGRGMYAALSTADGKGRIDYESAFNESRLYGPWHVNMTIDKSAKLISLDDARDLAQQKGFNSDNWADKDIGGEDIGAFAAAMGYDGVIGWPGKTGTLEDNIKTIHMSGTYVNLVNRTKVTVYDSSGFKNEGDLRQTTGMVDSQNGCINVNAIQGNPLF